MEIRLEPKEDNHIEVIKKRTRKPWVYKSDYDNLNIRYTIAKWFALAGWIAFAITLKILLQV